MMIAIAVSAHAADVVFGAELLAPMAEENLLEDMPSFGWVFVKMMVVLGAILFGLLVISKWVVPRLMRSAPMKRSGTIIEVLDVRRLEPRRNVYLLRVADQCFLIGTSEAGIQMLSGGELQCAEVESALSAARARGEGRSCTESRPPDENATEAISGEPQARSFAAMLKSSR